MQRNISLLWSLGIFGIMGVLLYAILVFFLTDTSSREPVQFATLPKQARSGLPVRLKIPKISVEAAFEYVGLTTEGAMDVPKDPWNAAWFDIGPRPGEEGSAVIAGHYGWKNGEASAFDNLYKLRIGDFIYIEDDAGKVITFVVRKLQRYNEGQNPSAVFSSNDGGVHLNLITCEGVWDEIEKSYSKRLVVFTDKT